MLIKTAISSAAVAAVAFLGSAGLTNAADQTEDTRTEDARKVYYFDTWTNIESYAWKSGDGGKPAMQRTGGVLYAGSNYFYCQQEYPSRYTDDQGNTNTWWAKTDDDSGNSRVLVPATAFTVGGDNEPIPGLPTC